MEVSQFEEMSNYQKKEVLESISRGYWIKRGTLVFLVLTTLVMAGCPPYNVWKQGLTGEAELARAEQNRKILINEAMAKKESAVYWAQAEVERARGAAQANTIVSDSLGGPEGYLRWLYIEKLSEIESGQIIYLPTEAGIPILEAGKRE